MFSFSFVVVVVVVIYYVTKTIITITTVAMTHEHRDFLGPMSLAFAERQRCFVLKGIWVATQ